MSEMIKPCTKLAANALTLCRTRGMPTAYSRWLARRLLGSAGPYLPLSNGARIGARWASFSEYWSFAGKGARNSIEPNCQLFLQSYASAEPGRVAVDGGANVGVFSIELAASGYEVHAFEPVPETCARLRENLALNPLIAEEIHVVERALADEDGLRVSMTAPGFSPSEAHITQLTDNAMSELLSVTTTTLDAYSEAAGLGQIDLLKLDVEGYEPAVLRGSSRRLREHAIRCILFEWCPRVLRRAGFDPGELLLELDRADYAVFRIGRGGRLASAESAALVEHCEWDNLVARPREACT